MCQPPTSEKIGSIRLEISCLNPDVTVQKQLRGGERSQIPLKEIVLSGKLYPSFYILRKALESKVKIFVRKSALNNHLASSKPRDRKAKFDRRSSFCRFEIQVQLNRPAEEIL